MNHAKSIEAHDAKYSEVVNQFKPSYVTIDQYDGYG